MTGRPKRLPRIVYTAIHEAGHAVSHYRLLPEAASYGVSIRPDRSERTLGAHDAEALEGQVRKTTPEERAEAVRLGVTNPDFIWELGTTSIEAQIVVLYAGEAAARHRGASALRPGGRTDRNQAAMLLSRGIPGVLPGLAEPEREPELRRRAADFVGEHWREIEAVAVELLRHTSLDGEEVALICDAAAGDPDADVETYRAFRGATLARTAAVRVEEATVASVRTVAARARRKGALPGGNRGRAGGRETVPRSTRRTP